MTPAASCMEPFSATSVDGLTLQGTWNLPAGPPRGVVVHVHGFGEHHRRHDRVAAALANAGLAVLRFDLRGHGHSGGPRGDFDSYDQLLDDVDVVMDAARQRFPDLRGALYGHSFGGGVVANRLLRNPMPHVAAAVLSSPWFELAKNPGGVQRCFARAAATIVPAWTVPTGIRAENLASNPEAMREYRGDPLVIRRITLRAVLAAIDAGEYALRKAQNLTVPTLVMHGTGDRITSFRASELFFSLPENADVELKLFDNLAHEMHFEDSADEVIGFATQWLTGRL